MKFILFLHLCVLSFCSFSQDIDTVRIGGFSSDRFATLEESLAIDGKYADLFWPLYYQYQERSDRDKENELLVYKELMDSNEEIVDGEGKEPVMILMNDLVRHQFDEVSMKGEYFSKINSALNGIVAYKFLQHETLFNLILKSRFYDLLAMGVPKWTPAMLEDELAREEIIGLALAIGDEQREALAGLLRQYEFQYARTLGHELAWFEQYIEDPQGLTPAQCKKLGDELLDMERNEITVNGKYFRKVAQAFGTRLAVRFFVLQDYYNTMAKLHIWSIYPVAIADAAQR